MPDDELQLKKLLRDLFKNQLFGVLATQHLSGPYSNLIAFTVTEDLSDILFVTRRETNKYLNLLSNGNVSVLVDNRTNSGADLHNAVAVTAVGSASEVRDSLRESLLQYYLVKHHGMERFAHSPESALFRIRVKKYFVVRNFQQVIELKMAI